MNRWAVCLSALMLGGCGRGPDLMPMEVGRRWQFAVSTQFQQYLADMTVSREASVAGHKGFVLLGATGECRLAWVNGRLLAERISNTRFEPPIPLVVQSEDRERVAWKGVVQGNWGRFEATASLNQVMTEKEISGSKTRVAKSDLVILNSKGPSIRLETLFEPNVGIAQQQQWIGSNSVLKLTRQS